MIKELLSIISMIAFMIIITGTGINIDFEYKNESVRLAVNENLNNTSTNLIPNQNYIYIQSKYVSNNYHYIEGKQSKTYTTNEEVYNQLRIGHSYFIRVSGSEIYEVLGEK